MEGSVLVANYFCLDDVTGFTRVIHGFNIAETHIGNVQDAGEEPRKMLFAHLEYAHHRDFALHISNLTGNYTSNFGNRQEASFRKN